MAQRTPIELYVIDKIKEKRTARGMSLADFARLMGSSEFFIGILEDPEEVGCYSLTQINQAAEVLECSIHDLLPAEPL